MPIPITLVDLLSRPEPPLLIDVRRTAARTACGRTIANSLRGDPEHTDGWGIGLAGRTVVVYCVHGHEVSQGVADRLEELGVDAAYLVGGFAEWESGGHPVVAIGVGP